MAQYRQAGAERFAIRGHDFHNGNGSSDQISSIGIRIPHKQGRFRRSVRSEKNSKISISTVLVILALVLVVTVFAFNYLFRDKEYQRFRVEDDDVKSETDFLSNGSRTVGSKVLKFGQGSVSLGRDSRYWDRDDRRRDDEYNEDASELNNVRSTDKDRGLENKSGNKQLSFKGGRERFLGKQGASRRSIGLYNEAGRDELKHYEAEYEASLKNVGQARQENSDKHGLVDGVDMDLQNEEADFDDEYDDGFDSQDDHMEEFNRGEQENVDYSDVRKDHDDDEVAGESSDTLDDQIRDSSSIGEDDNSDESFTNTFKKGSSMLSQSVDNAKKESRRHSVSHGESMKRASSEKKSDSRRRGKRPKFSSSSCEMKFLNSTTQLVEPVESRKFSRFSLQYTEVEYGPNGLENWEPRFAGHQSLQEREESFYARDQKINCGFIKGPKGYPSTGFDLAEDDVRFMRSCHIAVSSCIFGNSDNLRTPTNKMVTHSSRKNVCFVMFIDENALQTLSSEGQKPDRMGYIGLWKIVVVKNIPYTDMRRVGKVPKLLAHRLFPSARYSIWLDGKLRLQRDPLLLLEYFLWRHGAEYAISNHYDRHCVWEEVMQNKKLNKFNHTIIDQQFAFYQADGLKRFNASDPNKLLPSYVPEGSFIVRAHTPMSNLFSCLWFNEVERFTPRDQLSFAYTYLKLRRMNPGKPFHLHMFKDCERRSIAKLFHHRSEEKNPNPIQETG
ncbi:uncharacterized protein LOC143888290 [Tasmannia lanceolata]|uniref:uncharacterized protein LOC143888290 n=1 Tax=Tasmannia lanceolata TaxID=3420 RepID=UPI004062ED49